MDWKKIRKALLFPPLPFLCVLFPFSIGGMLYAMARMGEDHPVTILFYVLAFYMLVVWCVRLPELVRFLRTLKRENRYLRRWFGDARLRMNVTLSCTVLWNAAYAALQLGLGIYHRSAWFYSLAAYYILLGVMRFFLVRHTLRHEPGKEQARELRHYRACGWTFLTMNLALSGMMLNMIRENRVTQHHEITTIAMAAYTFFTLTWAIIHVPRYRKYNSPAMSAARVVSLAAACVSMLTLENTMLSTFGDGSMRAEVRQLFLALSGGAVSICIVVMAIYMIYTANQKIKMMEN